MKVILKHAGRWLHFQCPEKVLVAEKQEDVIPMLAEAEESGLFAAGFLSYEASPAFDSALQVREPDGFPLLYLGLFQAPSVLEDIEEVPGAQFEIGELESSVSKDEFSAAIHSIKERIAEGATYQVNYTYRLGADFTGDAWAFFYELVKGQKTEYAAFVETDDFSICSASPELFFRLNRGMITARPMKGTAPRGLTFSDDWKQSEMLQASEKDRAENIMIVDMIRNDIGRVAEPGSVETVSTYDVEKYPTVWQMTSTVRGKFEPRNFITEGRKDREALQEACGEAALACGDSSPLLKSAANVAQEGGQPGQPSLPELFKALFPCASITGAPKAKTMEIIRDLECSPRKIYTGSIGFFTPQGEACFNVAIRTALIEKGWLEFGIGGGIVWDSDAEAEYEETLTKARVLTQPRPEFKLLETMLWEPENGIFLKQEHLQRLGKSAAYFDIPLDMHALFMGLDDAIQSIKPIPHRIRLLVAEDGNSVIQTFPLEEQTTGGELPPVRVAIARESIDLQDRFLYHKTTHRAVYESAKAQFPDHDDVILWNENGAVTESTIANVVVRKGERMITPPIACGLLGGTFRESLLKSGEIEEGLISLEELRKADEVYLINSVRKWRRASVEV